MKAFFTGLHAIENGRYTYWLRNILLNHMIHAHVCKSITLLMRFLFLVPPEGAPGGVMLRRRHRLALRRRGVVVVLGDLGAGAVGGRARALAPGADAGSVEDATAEGTDAADGADSTDAAGGGKMRGGLHDGVTHLLAVAAFSSADAGITK